jgi:hypothetical protein
MHTHTSARSVQELGTLAAGGTLFAILDACDTPSVPEKVRALGDAHAVSLYRGSAEEQFEAIAPYLVQVDVPLLEWIVSTLWAEPWGIFAESSRTLEELRTHFRKFLVVKSPQGEDWYFRYYDPRVLPGYFNSCTRDEVQTFFGPVREFVVTDAHTGAVTSLRPASL